MKKPNGLILWQGPSRIDGAPIVAIVVGLEDASTNSKTGAMLQTYILRADIAPTDAIAIGADASICGDCPHRGDGTGKGRTCYVNVGQGALSVYRAFLRGNYPMATDAQARLAGTKRVVRLGTYGDPAAVPVAVWENLTADAVAHTGYTHAWRGIGSGYAHLLMASADSVADKVAAMAAGFCTFRVVLRGESARLPGEARAPTLPVFPRPRTSPRRLRAPLAGTLGLTRGGDRVLLFNR